MDSIGQVFGGIAGMYSPVSSAKRGNQAAANNQRITELFASLYQNMATETHNTYTPGKHYVRFETPEQKERRIALEELGLTRIDEGLPI